MSAWRGSWGRYPGSEAERYVFGDRRDALPVRGAPMLPYGNGRSYGDSCLNDKGVLIQTRSLDRYISFDPATGLLRCESGVLFSEILDLVVTQGWFLPVTPGTKYVTVGGAIANDVHGKNHHRAGTIGRHVREFELLRSDSSRLICSPEVNPDWFAATIGGLGLTGLITEATLQLKRVPGPWMSTETHRFDNLQEFFELSEESDSDYEYTVAWIDCIASGRRLGRGLFTRANHAPAVPDDRPPAARSTFRVPMVPPLSLINRVSLLAFNTLYFHKQGRAPSFATTHYEPHFYPLDKISDWNRVYGPTGFLQYQCVVPPEHSPDAISELIGTISRSGSGSFLAVLKQFGQLPSPGMLSFPRPGTTLALDFPNRGKATFELLDRLDRIVLGAFGAVYPAKDARMSGDCFRRYFPAWESFGRYVDPHFSSSFWRRVTE